jgi:hypothetical protein
MINGRFDHSRRMDSKMAIQDWLTEDDKLLADLESACIAADMENLIPTDQQICTNYQTAASDTLWSAVMRQLEHESIQAGYSVLIKHKSIAQIRMMLCRAQETVDSKLANNQIRLSKPKNPKPTTSTNTQKTKTEKDKDTKVNDKTGKENTGSRTSTLSAQDLAARTEARKLIDCQYWKEGTCRLGEKCEFKHDAALKNSQVGEKNKTTNETAVQDDGEEFSLAYTQPLKDSDEQKGSITWDTRVAKSGEKSVSVITTSQDDFTEFFSDTNPYQELSSSEEQPEDHAQWLARMQVQGNRHGSGKEVSQLIADGAEILGNDRQRAAKNVSPQDWQQPHWRPQNSGRILLMDVGNEKQHILRSDSDLEEDNSIDLGSGSDEEAKVDKIQDLQTSITSFFTKISPTTPIIKRSQSDTQSVYYAENTTVTASKIEQDSEDSDDEDLIMPSTNSDFYFSCQCMIENHEHCSICGQCQGEFGCCNCDDIPIKNIQSITPVQHFR